MAREKLYFAWEIPRGVVLIVTALIADYPRRERAVNHGDVSGAVLERFVLLNQAIDEASLDVEDGIRKALLNDIAAGRGYTRSVTQNYVSKNTYYRRRRKLIHDVAVSLSLL